MFLNISYALSKREKIEYYMKNLFSRIFAVYDAHKNFSLLLGDFPTLLFFWPLLQDDKIFEGVSSKVRKNFFNACSGLPTHRHNYCKMLEFANKFFFQNQLPLLLRACASSAPLSCLMTKDIIAKMFQAFLMTTFSSSLFVRQGGQAKEYKEAL
jgi:hypothetical protein